MDDWDPTWYDKKEAGGFKKGDPIIMNEKPCKVTNTTKAKPGKHGSAKAIITGASYFDGKTVEASFGTGDLVEYPIIKRNEYLLLGVDDDHLSLLDDDGNQKDDVRMPEKMHTEVKKQIEDFLADDKQVLVMVQTILGVDMVCACREEKD